MTTPEKRFIACGMYSFHEELQRAWQALFDRFRLLLEDGNQLEEKLVFDTAESVLRCPGLFIGHTCGYPLMKHLQDAVTPFCVPVFDVTGVEDRLYCSRFIVAADAAISSLADCRARTVAIKSGTKGSSFSTRADRTQRPLASSASIYFRRAPLPRMDATGSDPSNQAKSVGIS